MFRPPSKTTGSYCNNQLDLAATTMSGPSGTIAPSQKRRNDKATKAPAFSMRLRSQGKAAPQKQRDSLRPEFKALKQKSDTEALAKARALAVNERHEKRQAWHEEYSRRCAEQDAIRNAEQDAIYRANTGPSWCTTRWCPKEWVADVPAEVPSYSPNFTEFCRNNEQ